MIYIRIQQCFLLSKENEKEKDLEGGRCLKRSNGRLGFSEEERARIWNEHKEKIVNKVTRNEIVETMRKMKLGKAT